MEYTYIEGHMHLFEKNDIAEGAMGNKLLFHLANKHTMATVCTLHNIIPFTDKDALDKLKNFVIYEKQTQLQKLTTLKNFYPTNTKYNVLSINQHYLGAGKVARSYESQLKELIGLKQAGEPINIFFFVEPRDPENFKLLMKYEKHITGLKIYPNWGYFPYDSRLNCFWRWANDNSKPVIAHCTEDAAINYRGKDIDYLLEESLYTLNECKTRKQKAGNFANPKGLLRVAIRYPKLKMVAAHLGGVNAILGHMVGQQTYTTTILSGCQTVSNFYTDISFCSYEEVVVQFIKTLMLTKPYEDKFLFGTDFYMNQTVTFQKEHLELLKRVLGSSYHKMIKINNNLVYN